MFVLVSGRQARHVGAHTDGHQHGVSVQISINLGKKFLRISRIRKIAVTRILARVFTYLGDPKTLTPGPWIPLRTRSMDYFTDRSTDPFYGPPLLRTPQKNSRVEITITIYTAVLIKNNKKLCSYIRASYYINCDYNFNP